jgi:hypothetical protein
MRFIIAMVALAAPFAGAASLQEDFSSDPTGHGWRMLGQSNLFHWNSAAQNLQVTWDSSRPNSCFYHSLGTVLNRNDDFSVGLDLRLDSVAAGVNPTKAYTFQLAFGFVNIEDVSRTDFFRGSGYNSPNLVEFNFYPDVGDGPTIWPAIWSTNSAPNYNGPDDYTLLELPLGVSMRITMEYTATNSTLNTVITTNGVSIGPIHSVQLSSFFTDFHPGAFAVTSYSDEGQDPQYGGSLLATGVVDNVQLNFPPPPLQKMSGFFQTGAWQVGLASRTNWLYTLERTTNFEAWQAVSPATEGNGTNLVLLDTAGPVDSAFYRVQAERP